VGAAGAVDAVGGMAAKGGIVASKSTNKTIFTVAIVAIVAFLAYKLWPSMAKALKGSSSGSSSGGVGAGSYVPYSNPYYPQSQPQNERPLLNASFGPGGKSSGSMGRSATTSSMTKAQADAVSAEVGIWNQQHGLDDAGYARTDESSPDYIGLSDPNLLDLQSGKDFFSAADLASSMQPTSLWQDIAQSFGWSTPDSTSSTAIGTDALSSEVYQPDYAGLLGMDNYPSGDSMSIGTTSYDPGSIPYDSMGTFDPGSSDWGNGGGGGDFSGGGGGY
jgi:hypothetical protein